MEKAQCKEARDALCRLVGKAKLENAALLMGGVTSATG